jgi:excisionase family DNA binding protein
MGFADKQEAGGVYLTRAEVARLLGVSPNTVSRWAREGRLNCQMTLGGHRRFDSRVIEQLRSRMRGEAGILVG